MDLADGILPGAAETRPLRAASRGLRPDEMPFKPHLALAAGLPNVPPFDSVDESLRPAVSALLANLLLARWQPQVNWLFYARDNNHYAAVRALAPPWYTRRSVLAAIGWLSAAGLIEEQRTRPSPHARLRSRLRALPTLAAACSAQSLYDLVWSAPPPIILREYHSGRCLDPRLALTADELAELDLLAQDVIAHNQFLSRFAVGLHATSIASTGHLVAAGTHVSPLQRAYYRVFNGALNLGGRWYGPWWQSLSSDWRQRLTIDGQPTVECDFSACQLRLLLARCGHPDPLAGRIRHANVDHDPYRVTGIERKLVKSALIFMINADDRRRAQRALARTLSQSGPSHARRRADRIMCRVEAAFPLLRPYWFTGIGLELQAIDAAICAAVQRQMRTLDLPVLSVHDSFVTFAHSAQRLERVMADCFNTTYATLAARR